MLSFVGEAGNDGFAREEMEGTLGGGGGTKADVEEFVDWAAARALVTLAAGVGLLRAVGRVRVVDVDEDVDVCEVGRRDPDALLVVDPEATEELVDEVLMPCVLREVAPDCDRGMAGKRDECDGCHLVLNACEVTNKTTQFARC